MAPSRASGPRIFGEHDRGTLKQFHDVARQAEYAALMADGHLGYIMPIGGVAAYRDEVPVSGVGFDIACGNAAIRTDRTLDDLTGGRGHESGAPGRRYLSELADAIHAAIAFGVGRQNPSDDAPRDHPLFEDDAWGAVPRKERASLRAKARDQLGTVGGGNHYVDVFVDEEDAVWVGVHFGSRGFGHSVASGFLALSAGRSWGERVQNHPGTLSLDSELGHDYWQLMELAGRYAYAGREWAARKVVELMGGQELELVHNHHNFAWVEEHFDEEWIVVRKGATPAWPGQRGFVGASMAEEAVILEGAEHPEGSPEARLQAEALHSTVHGAGRVMSRRKAKRSLDRTDAVGQVEGAGVVLRGGGLDEAPDVYKSLDAVLEAQGTTIRVRERLRPVIVCMAPDRSLPDTSG